MRNFIPLLVFGVLTLSCGRHDDKQDAPPSPPPKNPTKLNGGDSTGVGTHIDAPYIPNVPGHTTSSTHLPQYQALSTAFPDTSKILSSPDTMDTLSKLTKIASPTQTYHIELARLLNQTATTDMAHVRMLMDAVYFPYVKYLSIVGELKSLKDASVSAADIAQKLEVERTIAINLSNSLALLANFGFQKASDLNLENGIAALELLYPVGGASPAFTAMLARAGTLSTEQKEKVMLLASAKYEGDFASDLAMEIFKSRSDKSMKSLLELTDRLQWLARDYTLIKSTKFFANFTHDNVMDMLTHQYSKDGSVALALYTNSSEKSHQHVLDIAETLTSTGKDYFVKNVMPLYQGITTDEARQLCTLANTVCGDVVLGSMGIWKDPTPESAAAMSRQLNYGNKDIWIKGVLKYFSKVTTDQAIGLIQASYQEGSEIGASLAAKITDMDIPHAVEISKLFNYGAKDKWLLIAETYIKAPLKAPLVGSQIVIFMNAAYDKKREFAEKLFVKVSAKTVVDIVTISKILNYGEKDKWMHFALELIPSLSSKEFYFAVQAAYDDKLSLAKKYVARINDLTPTSAAKISNAIFNYGSKDAWLASALQHIRSMTSADAIQIIEAAYDKKTTFAVDLLAKITDFKVASAVSIARLFNYGAKDTFLLAAVDKVTDLTRANLDSLVAAAYDKKAEIRKMAKKRMGE